MESKTIYADFDPKILSPLFSNKVREQCKSCKRYGTKATCPPHVDSVDYYKELLPTYNQGRLIISHFTLNESDSWISAGQESSLYIHNNLLEHRETFFKAGVFTSRL